MDDFRPPPLQAAVGEFVAERGWDQFHSVKNLSMAIAVEAAELMDLLKWVSDGDLDVELERVRTDLELEVADVMILCLALCNRLGIRYDEAISHKLAMNADKYPAEAFRGRWR